MTTINEPIRQASLFTMHGLIDPRWMPRYSENSRETRVLKKSRASSVTLRGILQNIWRRRVGYL